jgi:pterin-4a-carbinolamine dehydratase
MRASAEASTDNSGFAAPEAVEDAIRRGWRLDHGALRRDLEFRDFEEAMRFALELGRNAVDWQRRPDMLIQSHHLKLSVANLHHAGFTLAEMRLVAKATAVIDEHQSRGIGQG